MCACAKSTAAPSTHGRNGCWPGPVIRPVGTGRTMVKASVPQVEIVRYAIDLRSLSPIDYGPILDSVRRTGRMVYAQEAPGNVSVGSEVAATVMERAFFALESPVIRVSGFDVPFPPAKLEGTYLPDADRILEAVDRALAY